MQRIEGNWRLASSFFSGSLRCGSVPRPPPPPPPNPAQERKIRVLCERFRVALNRGDGKTACSLRTAASDGLAVDRCRGRKAAGDQDFGELNCAAVSSALRIPAEKVKRITVESGRGRLTLEHGATYGFRLIEGRWKLDS